jgi:hypothetical protein
MDGTVILLGNIMYFVLISMCGNYEAISILDRT